MKHHIFHKSYRHFHILSFIIAVVIAGVWIHLSTQTAKSDIKLGYIRNFTTTNSDDLGDIKNDTKPNSGGGASSGESIENGSSGSTGGNGGGVIKQMTTSLVTYVKRLIGLASPTTTDTTNTDNTSSSAEVVVPDPCLALTDANRTSVLTQKAATTRSSADSITAETSSSRNKVKNPCTQLPIELLPCAANYSDNFTEQVNTVKSATRAGITGAEIPLSAKTESREQVLNKTKNTVSSVTPCTFIRADSAKESLKRTLLATVQSNYLPTIDLKPGDTSPAVLKLQQLMVLLGGDKETKQLTGVYDAATVEVITKFQEDMSKNFDVKVTGILDGATRTAFLNLLSLQIDEFLSSFKDYVYATGATSAESSSTAATRISLDKVPVVKPATPAENGGDVTYSDTDPCLALVPVDPTKGPGTNPCHNIPQSLLPCAINYVTTEKGEVVYDAARGGEACKFIKASTAQESLQKTVVAKTTQLIATVKLGDKGSAVAVLQSVLNTVLFLKPENYKVTVDGNYGSAVTDFIKQFQTNAGLTVDGILGKETQSKMMSSFNDIFTLFMAQYRDKSAVEVFAGDPCTALTTTEKSSSATASAVTPVPAAGGAPTPAPAEKAEATTANLINPCAKAPKVLVPCAAEYADPKNYPKKSSCVFPVASTAKGSLMKLIMDNAVALLPGKDVSLVLGTTSDAVKNLQILLNAVFGSVDNPVVAEDGIYDAKMVSYIADMQKSFGLQNDGVFGTTTRNALYDKVKSLIDIYLSYFDDSSLKYK